MRMWSILEASAKNDDTTTVKIIATCLILSIAWLWWDHNIKLQNPRDQISGENSEKNNSCNDPNCIRCHSKSKCHWETLERNVILLRRLMKMEPDIFEGMREEIVRVAEENVAKMHVEIDHRGSADKGLLNLSNSLKKTIHFLRLDYDNLEWNKKYFQRIESQGMSCSEKMTSNITLSPQPGQDPTVFFLPGLEAVPLHKQTTIHHMKQSSTQSINDGPNNGNQCNRGCHQNCPCNRLWQSSPMAEKTSSPIRLTGDIEALHQNFHIIRKELQQLISHNDHFVPFDTQVYSNVTEPSRTSANIDTTKKKPSWSSIYLYHQGLRESETCNKYFPQTTHLIESMCPHRMAGKCGLGSVYFSKLDPNIKVMEHCGPTNVRWRCHIPLVVPNTKGFNDKGWESRSHLRVGRPGVNEQIVKWEEGIPILFDDSFLHSALHVGSTADEGADESRIVLIIDFWHPSLSEADRIALGVLYPPGS